MALVQVREVFRQGLVQKVARYVSPPNSNSMTSFLWRADSFSMQRRTLLLARMREFRASFFSPTQVPTPPVSTGTAASGFHTTVILEQEIEAEDETVSTSGSATTSSGKIKDENDEGTLDRTYGEQQKDHGKVADASHEHHVNTKKEDEPETLEETGFDMSKRSRPTGDE